MNRIRLATEEEVNSIRDKSDLDEGCVVFALDTHRGVGLAVRRICTEIDPLIPPPDWDLKLRSMFIRDIETLCWGQGIKSYYFNTESDDTTWQHVVETWGAERLSPKPVVRYKKTL